MVTNLSNLKYKLYKMYNETGEIHSLVNDCIRLGMLAERYKNDPDREMGIQEVFDEYNKDENETSET